MATTAEGRSPGRSHTIPFTVASALLRELGERLVGRPHIALAELVKNAYDADARNVTIRFDDDAIVVSDDGHGMTFAEFRDFWMRVGTPHKQSDRVSRKYHRPLTGSKGVGRLAVQFLARKLEIRTAAEPGRHLRAFVDWEQAIEHDLLTQVVAHWDWDETGITLPGNSQTGTVIELTGLNQAWEDEAFRDLAREIWVLQPPFPVTTALDERPTGLSIALEANRPSAKQRFDEQMAAVKRDWIARIQGEILPQDDPNAPLRGRVRVSFTHRALGAVLSFDDRSAAETEYEVKRTEILESGDAVEITSRAGDLTSANYDIRIYNLSNRQPEGIRVDELRRYLKEFGGVHIYDGGFRLPFYGSDTDWLNIEKDHSHRKNRSSLLPDKLQAPRGLNDLPTNERIFGMVLIDTGRERQAARQVSSKHLPGTSTVDPPALDYLTLSVTRDRLIDNRAFAALRDFVRFGVDYYATETARRKHKRADQGAATVKPSADHISQLNRTLDEYANVIPEPVLADLKNKLQFVQTARRAESELETQRIGLLGALATAGITAIAYEHEVSKQLHRVDGILKRLSELRTGVEGVDSELDSVRDELRDYLVRTRATRALFTNVMNEDNRTERIRYRAQAVIQSTAQQMGVLLRGTQLDLSAIDPEIRLPAGTYAEWAAVFQNILINAVNAMLDSTARRISVKSIQDGKERRIVIEDTGTGVDLATAETLFEPFQRRQQISSEHAELGYGGTGLGLTIVRMITSTLGCRVQFVEASSHFATAIQLSWEEA